MGLRSPEVPRQYLVGPCLLQGIGENGQADGVELARRKGTLTGGPGQTHDQAALLTEE
jgi:hypothetical protein